MPLVFTYPVTSPTITITLQSVFAQLVNPRATVVQSVHLAQGGKAFVFTPGGTPVVNRVLPVDIRSLPEANAGGYTGWAALNTFLVTTLQGAKFPCTLLDPDGTSYIVRFLEGLDSMTEVQFERWSGQLLFRQEI